MSGEAGGRGGGGAAHPAAAVVQAGVEEDAVLGVVGEEVAVHEARELGAPGVDLRVELRVLGLVARVAAHLPAAQRSARAQ